MAARIWLDIGPRVAHLQRLSVLFAVELRLKIVTELYIRPMSPKQFQAEFGGGSIERVDKNFKRLAESGWLRKVDSKTGGDRRGAREHFYRATELAYFDAKLWTLLPLCVRTAYSWTSFGQIADQIRQAMERAATLGRPLPDFKRERVVVDQIGWDRVIDEFDRLFSYLYEEQEDSRFRIAESKERLIRASVVQFGFEAPIRGDDAAICPDIDDNLPIPFPARLSAIFGDETCLRIVTAASEREVSVKEFSVAYDEQEPSTTLYRRFRRLNELGWLEKGRRKRGEHTRGGMEQYYRAVDAPRFSKISWKDIPNSVQSTKSWLAFEHLSADIKAAMEGGTFDTRPDRYLAWSLIGLDRQGWQNVSFEIRALREMIRNEEECAWQRLATSDEKPITMTTALSLFESTTIAREP